MAALEKGAKNLRMDGTHVIGQPGITAGREAQGTQTSLEQSSDSMTRQQGTLSWME